MRRTSGSKAETYYFMTHPRDLIMGMPHFLLLSCVGLFISAQAQDCQKPAGGANMDLSDNDIVKNTFPDGTNVKFVCNSGYRRAGGNPTITCTAGSWSSLTLTCQRKECGSVGDLLNGDVTYDPGNEFGDKAIFTCKPGFRLVGKNERTCGDQGWMGRNPECEAVSCDPPPEIANGYFSPREEIYTYQSAVMYQCEKGLTMVGLATLTCSENGQFSPSPPACKGVKCEEPAIKDGFVAESSQPPYGYQATVTIACNPGYKLKGQARVVCGVDNNWSPELPKCEVVTCPQPPSVTYGSFSPVKQIYQVGEEVEYSCDKDYEMNGPKTVSCSGAGTFRPAAPTCTQSGAPGVNVPLAVTLSVLVPLAVAVIAFIIYRKYTGKESTAIGVGVDKKAKEDEEAVSLSGTRKNADQASDGTGMEMKA